MILGIAAETGIFLYACLAGVTVLSAYGVLICFRRLIRHSAAVISAEDFAFWIGASIYIFRKMYDTTYGNIRWFFVLGILCGCGAAYLFFRGMAKIWKGIKKKLENSHETG